MLISHFCDSDLLVLTTALRNRNVFFLIEQNDLLSFTSLTNSTFVDYFPFTITLITISLTLSVHSWSHLHHFNNNSFSFTINTFFNIFASFTMTVSADLLSLILYIEHFAVKSLFQSDLLLHCSRFELLFLSFSLPSSIGEKHVENVSKTAFSSLSESFKTLHSVLIVNFLLFFVF